MLAAALELALPHPHPAAARLPTPGTGSSTFLPAPASHKEPGNPCCPPQLCRHEMLSGMAGKAGNVRAHHLPGVDSGQSCPRGFVQGASMPEATAPHASVPRSIKPSGTIIKPI